VNQRVTLIGALIGLGIASACGPGAPPSGGERRPTPGAFEPTQAMIEDALQDFETVRDGFIDWHLETHPVRASELGLHSYDSRMPDLSRVGIQRRIDDLLDWLGDLERITFDLMREEARYDYAVMEYALRAELLDLEELRSWASNPMMYTRVIATGLSSVARREYAPMEERLGALRDRLQGALGTLESARENLESPPALWTELAVADTRGLADYVEGPLPEMLEAQAGSPVNQDDLDAARSRLVAALREHADWLENDLLPRSTGTYRLGRYLLERKLLYEEHLSLTVEDLDRLNGEAIAEYQERLAQVAAEVDPERSVAEVVDSITHVYPPPEELLSTARAMMDSVRAWVETSGVVPLTTQGSPLVRESPAYARGAFAYLDPPGPFETGDLDAYYFITNVLPEWTEEQKRQHMSYFNYPSLLGVTIHETFPGHYVQVAYEREIESQVRRMFPARSFIEGWAHYAEQMVLDEGFRAEDPAARLGQLRRALLRHARWYASLHLHAMDEPLDDVVRSFMEIAYFDELPARREVIRATYDPTYLYYALGRMQILELRQDYREFLEEQDDEYTLRDFHDRLLSLGLPIPLAREVMIPRAREPRELGRPGGPLR
jgi:uncharacterized protein (DUF885 family)